MKTIVTHDGKFHADDVCAVAALSLVIDEPINVVRTRDSEIIEKAEYVVDVGGVFDPEKNRFDHHQQGGAGVRKNMIPYAAFGLVWKTFGEKLCGSSAVAELIDEGMVSPLDASDNGVDISIPKFENVSSYGIDSAINAFVSTWKEEDRDMDAVFLELVSFVKALLARKIVSERAKEEAKEYVERAYNEATDKRIIVLEGPYPVRDFLAKHPEPLFFIRPRPSDEKWSVETVRSNPQSFVNRKNLPTAWAGKKDNEMSEISGVEDAIFCHRGLFLAVAKSREGAIKLAQLAVDNQEN